jgi:large conductance mechanosensitive channel
VPEILKEFRDFLLRGNIVALAVAFVMGVAFAAVVTAFVNDLVMPIIAMIFGKQNFDDLTFTINDATFRYGAFITVVIQFVAIAAAVFFFVVRPVNALLQRHRSPAEEGLPDEERRHQELLAALRGAQS